jgi:hypothetical protein
MDRRLPLMLALVAACAEGSLANPGFGAPVSTTQPTPSDSGEEGDAEGTGTTSGGGEGGSSGPADESSSGSPGSGPQDSSSSGATDPSAGSSSDGGATDPSAGSSSGAVEPPPDPPPSVGPWESCEAATCDAGADCITVTGLDANDAYCAPTCVIDSDCPLPASGDATPFCALVADDAVDPTNCALVCEYDGADFGTCPNGMACTSIPGQAPTISLCMW